MRVLLGAVFNADHESGVCFPEKTRFLHQNIGFKVFENRILDFLQKNSSEKVEKHTIRCRIKFSTRWCILFRLRYLWNIRRLL